ncbi:MAG TPA: dTMP kinase [Clostridia bacterium]|jgi:dTMP kinase|nr:dTMP kinase [Clostridia bacterium]
MKKIKGFITFEGCEGVGKSTQVRLLTEYLTATAQAFIVTREPGGTPLAERIRELILTMEMDIYCEANLFAAARSEHINKVILPAISEGKLVICDRYIDSSVAYQGYARGLGEKTVLDINKSAYENCMPEYTVFIDMDPTNSWRKQKGKVIQNDRMEKENDEFHLKVFHGFKELAAKYPDRYISIVPECDKLATNQKIIGELKKRGVIN